MHTNRTAHSTAHPTVEPLTFTTTESVLQDPQTTDGSTAATQDETARSEKQKALGSYSCPEILHISSLGSGPEHRRISLLLRNPYQLCELHINGRLVEALICPVGTPFRLGPLGEPRSDKHGRNALHLSPRQMAAVLFETRSRLRAHGLIREGETLQTIGEILLDIHGEEKPMKLERGLAITHQLPAVHVPAVPEILHAVSGVNEQGNYLEIAINGPCEVIFMRASIQNGHIEAETQIHPHQSFALEGPAGKSRINSFEKGLFISLKQASAVFFMARDILRDTHHHAEAILAARAGDLALKATEPARPHKNKLKPKPAEADTVQVITDKRSTMDIMSELALQYSAQSS